VEQKLLDRSQKSLVFLKSNFSAVRNFKIQYQYDPFSNLKDVSQMSISKLWSLSKMVYFIFEYFSMKLGTDMVDGHEKKTKTPEFH
jgi:predicted KAP-like P-loop ATPase